MLSLRFCWPQAVLGSGWSCAPAPKNDAWLGSGYPPIPYHGDAIHEDVGHPDTQLMGTLERGAVGNRRWVEDDDIGGESLA